jgi:cytochrome b involved in lipid metabolism
MKGVDALMRIPPSTLKKHIKPDDAWTSINGKVYNITPYLKYHPGGEKELMRVAGRDGTKLFGKRAAQRPSIIV